MSQKTVERIIGKLATDEGARQLFRASPGGAIAALAQDAESLTGVEREALSAVDPDLLDRFADSLDPRLQRVRIPAPEDEGDRP